MKKMRMLLLGVFVLALLAGASIAKQQGEGGGDRDRDRDPDSCECIQFVDENADGICDNSGDCIPEDGTGRKKGRN